MKIIATTLRCAAAILVTLSTHATHAQNGKYPSTPVRMVVGTPAGGTTDVIARLIAIKMGESLGAPVIVENKPGASGLIAAEGVAKASPDGYTILMAPSQLATYRGAFKSVGRPSCNFGS